MKESSYNTKDILLKLKLDAEVGLLYDELVTELDGGTEDNQELLQQYTEEELNALSPREDPQDTDEGPNRDEGPNMAWSITYANLPQIGFVMYANHAGLRQRTYVLWNVDRLRKYNLSEVLDNAPENMGRESSEDIMMQCSNLGKYDRRYGRRAGLDIRMRTI
jgi:hypothetical protein